MRLRYFIIFLLALPACNNDNVYVWSAEDRGYRMTFNPALFSLEQIKGTHKLCGGYMGGNAITSYGLVGLNTPEGVVDLTDIRTKSEADFYNEYEYTKNEVEELTIIDNEFWQSFKRERLNLIEERYRLQQLVKRAYSDPQVLFNNEFSALCPLYVDIANLNDTTQLLKRWEDFFSHLEWGDKHLDYCNAQYLTTDEKVANARAEMITFGYWHCTLQKLAAKVTDPEEEFKKLFKKIEWEDYH